MNKRLIILILLVGSVGITYMLETSRPKLSEGQVRSINALIDQRPEILSYVWNDNRLSVGIVPEEPDLDATAKNRYANGICGEIFRLGVDAGYKVSVEVVDVARLKVDPDDWTVIGYALCK